MHLQALIFLRTVGVLSAALEPWLIYLTPSTLKSRVKKERLSASQGQENHYFRCLFGGIIRAHKGKQSLQAQGKYPGNFGGEQHFLPHCECLCGWGGISCGSSADPLAGSVVRESSVIGPQGKNSLVFIDCQRKGGWGGGWLISSTSMAFTSSRSHSNILNRKKVVLSVPS